MLDFQYFQWNVKKEMELRHGGECCHPAGASGAVFVHRGDLFDAGEQTAGRIGSAAGDWCGPRIYGDFQKGVLPVAHFRGDPGAAGFDPAAEPIRLLIV